MSEYVGVDWAKGRWVVVCVSGDTIHIDTEPAFLNVWEEYTDASAIIVDIPIGLPSDNPRACDREARESLVQGGSIFSVPARDAVYARNYDEAVAANEQAGCGGIGAQSWGIVPQIREVDLVLQRIEDARESIYESHPEVCFSILADEELQSKEIVSGRERRLDLLTEFHPGAGKLKKFVEERNNDNAEWHHRIQNGRIDDVLDAAVMAFTGEYLSLLPGMQPDSYSAFPADGPQYDETGLPMEIVHPGIQ